MEQAMTTDTLRQAFEAWRDEFTSDHYKNTDNDEWKYADNEELLFQAWQAATLAERERCAKVCEAYAIDRHALYKGRPPYTGQERQGPLPGRPQIRPLSLQSF
jgi:hypothetical protein